jgi:hypothetical protein
MTTSVAAVSRREPGPLFMLGSFWQAAHTRGVLIWLFIAEPRRLPGLDGMVFQRAPPLWSAYHPRLGTVQTGLKRSEAAALVEQSACFIG